MSPFLENLKATKSRLKLWCSRDWEAKLVALVLAFLLWYVIQDRISRGQRFHILDSTPPQAVKV